jgi:hypothetical protein
MTSLYLEKVKWTGNYTSWTILGALAEIMLKVDMVTED